MIETIGVSSSGVDTHEAETLSWFHLEIIDLFHGDFRRWRESIVLMRRATRPATGFAFSGRDRDTRIAIQPGERRSRAGGDENHGTGLPNGSARWDFLQPAGGRTLHFHPN